MTTTTGGIAPRDAGFGVRLLATRERTAAMAPVGDYAVHVNARAGDRNNIQVRDVNILRGLPGDTRDGSGWHGDVERTNSKKSPSNNQPYVAK